MYQFGPGICRSGKGGVACDFACLEHHLETLTQIACGISLSERGSIDIVLYILCVLYYIIYEIH